MPVTQEDIAQKLGVSRRLVGYALSGHPAINAETSIRIRETATSMGYRPHRVAQALASGRTYQIALCLGFLGSSFNNELIRRFGMLMKHTAYDLMVITFDPHNPGHGPSHLTVDGMIFVGPACFVPDTIIHPVVVLQNQLRRPLVSGEENSDRIQIDLESASFSAMVHLVAGGFRRIAYLAPQDMMSPTELRYYAYETIMSRAGLATEFISLPIRDEELLRQQSHQLLKTYFRANGFPDAIFCCNDDLGIGAYRALRELGRHIPDDTAILGFDDLDDAAYLDPPMSTVHMPIQAVCHRAWEMMMRRIEDEALPPQFETFKANLVIRQSSVAKTAAIRDQLELSRSHSCYPVASI